MWQSKIKAWGNKHGGYPEKGWGIEREYTVSPSKKKEYFFLN